MYLVLNVKACPSPILEVCTSCRTNIDVKLNYYEVDIGPAGSMAMG